MNKYAPLMEGYWQGKPEHSDGNPVPVPMCPPQVPHGSICDWIWASAVQGLGLTVSKTPVRSKPQKVNVSVYGVYQTSVRNNYSAHGRLGEPQGTMINPPVLFSMSSYTMPCTYEGVHIELYAFLTSALDEDDLSTSNSGQPFPVDITRYLGVQMNAVPKTKLTCSYR
jgi:hypothetical protein